MQTLEQFRTTFSSEPVEVVLDFAKEGTFPVWLKPLTSRQRDNFEASVIGLEGKGRDMHNLRARLVSLCWVNGETGEPMGTADEIGDGLRSDFVNALFEKVREMNGMDADADEAGKD